MWRNPQETVQCLEYLFTNIPSDKTIDICICIVFLHYKKDDIGLTSKLQNNFLYFCHAYCFD